MEEENAKATITGRYVAPKSGRDCSTITLECWLSDEDMRIVKEEIMPAAGVEELGRALHACLTYGIHKTWEDIHGKPYVLPIDRPKN